MVNVPLSENENGRKMIIILGIFLAFDYIFVLIRCWARHIKSRTFELNDWTLLMALTSVTAMYCLLVVDIVKGGLGLHLNDIMSQWGGTKTLKTAGKILIIAGLLWNVSALVIKVSILHLYITIFGRTNPKFRRIVWIIMAFCILSTLIFLLQVFLLCRPFAYFWDRSLKGKCDSLKLTYMIPGTIITIEDIVIFLLPMPILWKLKMKNRKKIGACFVFGFGLGICMISTARLKYLIDLNEKDFTGTSWLFLILGCLEPILGVITACLPMVPSVISHYSDNRLMAWDKSGISATASQTPGSTIKGLGNISSHTQHNDFERLSDHEYPLIHQAKPSLRNQCEVIGGDWSTQPSSVEGGAIKVTRQYTVDSQMC